ncbi:MAG: 5'-nucleotidase C-terminal domain-containing protein [Thermoguttaceae bacterium]|nr:5'-nucleotidase C-terminal domain-containing protein [Thermoguttaceae bacterium]
MIRFLRSLFILSLLRFLAVLPLVLTFSAFLAAETHLVVLHSNDHHGQLLPAKEVGGLTRFATLVKQIRKEAAAQPNSFVLLLDAGDLNTGTPESDFFNAKPDFEVYNHLAFDYVTFGNHEFDQPLERLKAQIPLARFPFGAANVLGADGQPLGTPFRIMEFPDCRVGIFGLTVANMNIYPRMDEHFTFLDEIETARKMVHFLREEKHVDLLIAVTHLGTNQGEGFPVNSISLAQAVPGIDLIVDGHSHTYMEKPLFVNETPIVSANAFSKYLGEARFTVEKGKIQSFSWRSIPVTQDIPEDPETAAILKPYLEEAAKIFKQVVAKSEGEFPGDDSICRQKETALGDLAGDCLIWNAKNAKLDCDFAFMNGGSLRATIPEGDVTLGNILTAFPFPNDIWILEFDGKTLLELFDFIANIQPGAPAFPHFSREVHLRVNEKTNEILELTIQGEPVDPEKKYWVAVTEFMAFEGDGYSILQKRSSSRVISGAFSKAMVNYIQSLPQPIKPNREERFVRETPEK